jgi:hypothetical protein
MTMAPKNPEALPDDVLTSLEELEDLVFAQTLEDSEGDLDMAQKMYEDRMAEIVGTTATNAENK